MTTRRARADSAAGAAEAFAAAMAGELMPPNHIQLRQCDIPFWSDITRTRARDAWTATDLVHAANLARCMADIERITAEIGVEGDVIENQRGTQILNPKHNLLETLTRRSVALCRIVQVHAQATAGDSRDQKKGNTKAKQTREIVDGLQDDDDLLARPVH